MGVKYWGSVVINKLTMKKKRGFWKRFWEKEKFTIGIITGMALTVMIIAVSLFMALIRLSIIR